jgi:hypothetical protein
MVEAGKDMGQELSGEKVEQLKPGNVSIHFRVNLCPIFEQLLMGTTSTHFDL